MARVDAPITYTQWVEQNGHPTRWFYEFILRLWERTGGSSDVDFITLIQTINQASPQASANAGQTVFQTEVSANYTITGDFDLEIVTCTNTTNITITMPTHYEGAEVIITRDGVGGVIMDGNGTNLLGLATQSLPLQHDSVHWYGQSADWGGSMSNLGSVPNVLGRNALRATNWIFDVSQKTLRIPGQGEATIVYANNVTKGVVLYNSANPATTAVVVGNRYVELAVSTTGMSDDDELLIMYDAEPEGDGLIDILLHVVDQLKVLNTNFSETFETTFEEDELDDNH